MYSWPGSRGQRGYQDRVSYDGPHDYSYPGRKPFLVGYNLDSQTARHGYWGVNRFRSRAGQLWYGNAQNSFMGMQRPGAGGYAGGYY